MPAIRPLSFLLCMLLAACASAEVAEREMQARQGRTAKQQQATARYSAPVRIERPPVAHARSAPPAVTVPQSMVPQGPAPVAGCDPGGCWSGGVRYYGGAGTYLDPGGRLCQSNGTWMQCF